MEPLTTIARTTTERHALLPYGAPVLVMVSGGGDSVALLRLLASGALGVHPVFALHVNHLLRGPESEADQAFVVELCAGLGVPLTVERVDIAAIAESEGGNLEDVGRRVRYELADAVLDARCAELGVPAAQGRVAVAHTRDDRIETFFVRALTGAGAGALASIRARRGRIVRPLLDCDRTDVRSYLESLGQPWCEDASNADVTRQRALVRSALVPVAEQVNPAFRSTLARTLDLLADDDAVLSSMTEAFVGSSSEVRDGELWLYLPYLSTLDRTMLRRTLRSALLAAFPEASRIEAEHVEALADGVAEDTFARDLGFGLRAHTEYDKMVVFRSSSQPPRVAPRLLPLPGTADLGDAGVMVAEPADPSDRTGTTDSVVVDASSFGAGLEITSVVEGDRMRPLGMEGSRKVSDLLIDEKVPKRERLAVPIVRAGDAIVWVAGVRMSDEYRVGPSTTRAVRLTWRRPSGRGSSGEGVE